jgi:hypothetical protein
MNQNDNFIVPSAQQYIDALTFINITENQKKMLEYHYKAHNRTVTYGELAKSVGFPNFNSANLQYGNLGKLLGEKIGMTFALSSITNEPFFSSSIGYDNLLKSSDSDYQLVMHHELAKALNKLGWFDN